MGDWPCRVNQIPRPIPTNVWFQKPLATVVMGGLLPFGSIFIEMYFIFTSFFNYKYYFVYGVMLLVFCILLVVSLCVSIVGTYCLLNAEDHRWPWVSLLTGASVGGYMWLYAVYYYL